MSNIHINQTIKVLTNNSGILSGVVTKVNHHTLWVTLPDGNNVKVRKEHVVDNAEGVADVESPSHV